MSKVVYLVMILVIVGFYCGFGIPMFMNIDKVYEGHEVFNTETEYIQFKQILVDTNAQWGRNGRMDVLSSTPPIIVDYEVWVGKDILFPYGRWTNDGLRVLGAALGFIGIGVLSIAGWLILNILEHHKE